MKPFGHKSDTPDPERLAAFGDGELDTSERREIEAWLAEHGEAAAEVEAQHNLERLLEATRPIEPPESAWTETLEQIEAGLTAANAFAAKPPSARRAHVRSGWVGWIVRLTAVAAAIALLGVLEPPELRRGARHEPVPPAGEEEHGMDADDSRTFASGEPSLRDPLDLATAGEVIIHSVQPDIDGMVPQVWGQGEETAVPMIVAPLVVVQTTPRINP
jgi:anti-sigma factor RsiW